jgi:hypothetical protein
MSAFQRGRTHHCAVRKCPADIPLHHLMCAFHWHKVASETQREFFRSIHAFKAGRLGEQPYAAAVDQAVKEATS